MNGFLNTADFINLDTNLEIMDIPFIAQSDALLGLY